MSPKLRDSIIERVVEGYLHAFHDSASPVSTFNCRQYFWNIKVLHLSIGDPDITVLSLTAHAFKAAFGLEKSNGELRKQFITSGSVQFNGEKLTDTNAVISPKTGDVLKLSKKHAVRLA